MAKRSTKHLVRFTIKGEVVTDDLVTTLHDLDAQVGCLPGDVELLPIDARPISDAKAAAITSTNLAQGALFDAPAEPAAEV